MSKTARILSIAGSDSGGGAGIQADIKTITMLGGHAMTAVTAVTAQNSQGVRSVAAMDSAMVADQIGVVLDDFGTDAVKIGMLGSSHIAATVAKALSHLPDIPIIFDPVMVATSGAELADEETISGFFALSELATLITPNRYELEVLGGVKALLDTGCSVLEKGGHDGKDTLVDRLHHVDGTCMDWRGERIMTPHSHGTGCTLSSAIATLMGQGQNLAEAIDNARNFVRLALHDAPDLVGDNGPMGHGNVRNDAMQHMPTLNQITIVHDDYLASCAFYKLLGMQHIVDSPARYARYEGHNGVTLSTHGKDIADAGQDSADNGPALYFETTALDALVAAVRKAGHVVSDPVEQSWGWREAWTRDPAGNRICLYHAGEHRRYPPWRKN